MVRRGKQVVRGFVGVNSRTVLLLLPPLASLMKSRFQFNSFNVVQFSVEQFEAILDEVRHYLHTVGDTNSVVSQVDSMQEQASHLLTSLKEGVVGNLPPNSVHSAVHKAKAWYTSAERFVQHLTKEYPLYCDLLAPFVAGISQVGESKM